jgi:hypothetical protein
MVMGKIKNGALSGPSGKIGNLVGSSWRGISYLKTRPAHYNDANTIAQQTTRTKMKLTIEFLKQCLPVVRIGFLGYSSPTRAAFHAATSFNYHNGIKGTFPDLEVDFTRALVTHGTLPAADEAFCEPAGESRIRFTWTAASDKPGARWDDTVLLLAYCPDRKNAVYNVQGSIRSDGEATLKVLSDFSGHEVHCFLGFANLPKLTSEQLAKYVSDSMYSGKLTAV